MMGKIRSPHAFWSKSGAKPDEPGEGLDPSAKSQNECRGTLKCNPSSYPANGIWCEATRIRRPDKDIVFSRCEFRQEGGITRLPRPKVSDGALNRNRDAKKVAWPKFLLKFPPVGSVEGHPP